MNPLALFYNNENEREAVKAFMIEVLGEIAIEKTFEGQDVKGIKDAHDLVERVFDKLADTYGILKEPIVSNSR